VARQRTITGGATIMGQVTKSEATDSRVHAVGIGNESTPVADCHHCLYRLNERLRCVAFPSGIPLAIVRGDVRHNVPQPGDGGFHFVRNRQR
jgi:hypothetical protein